MLKPDSSQGNACVATKQGAVSCIVLQQDVQFVLQAVATTMSEVCYNKTDWAGADCCDKTRREVWQQDGAQCVKKKSDG